MGGASIQKATVFRPVTFNFKTREKHLPVAVEVPSYPIDIEL